MASPRPLDFQYWLQCVVKHRVAIIGAGLAAAVVGITTVAAVFRRGRKEYSRTAEIACLLRALARKESEPRYRTRDFLAEFFLPWHIRMIVRLLPSFIRRKADATVPAGRSWLIARTHIYDHLMESTLLSERDITQVVILGAGFDSRFYRLLFPKDREIRFIEVDEHSTQARKRSVLRSVPDSAYEYGKTTNHVNYISMNLEQSMASLEDNRYDPRAKTFFLWEAVTPYLTEEAVKNVLAYIKTHSGPGSLIAFDVRYKEALTGQKTYTMSPLASTVGNLREPFKFGVPEGTTRQWVQSLGFEVHALYGPPELSEYVTSDDTDSYSLPIPDIMDIVVARVPR